MTLHVERLLESADRKADAEIVLDYDARQKSRFRAVLADGREIHVRLARGSVLAEGSLLLADDGTLVRVVAAPEPLSVTSTRDTLLLARAAYHLGNRHVPLQIDQGRLKYRHDHVLDAMLGRLGLEVTFERSPFVPESGAYGHGQVRGHDHHDHEHDGHGHGHGG